MAHVHNALHHAARLQAAYRTAVGESDPSFTGIERAGETLTPILNPWQSLEWAILRGDIHFARKVASAAVAARYSSVELVNPSTSGRLAVVEGIIATNGTGATVNIGIDNGAALGTTATTNGVPRDSRFNQVGAVSACTVVTGDLASTVALPQEELHSGTPIISTCGYVLRPGSKLFLIAASVNAAIGITLWWRERIAGEDELARFGS